MSDSLLLSLSQSALAKVVAGQKSASLAPFVHKKAPSFRALTKKVQHLPFRSVDNNVSTSVQLPRFGLIQNVMLRLTIRSDTGIIDDTQTSADSVLDGAWAYALWDNCTLSSHGKVIATVTSRAAYEYASKHSDTEVSNVMMGWAAIDGHAGDYLEEKRDMDEMAAYVEGGQDDNQVAFYVPKIDPLNMNTTHYRVVTALVPIPFGILRQQNADCLDTTFLEQLDLTIQWKNGFSETKAFANGVVTVDDGTKKAPTLSIQKNRQAAPHGLMVEGSGFEIQYVQLNSEDAKQLATMKYSSPSDDFPKSNLYCNYYEEPVFEPLTYVQGDGEKHVSKTFAIDITCKNCIVRSFLMIQRGVGGGFDKLTPIDTVTLECNGVDYWKKDLAMAYADQLYLANSMAVPAANRASDRIFRISYNVQDNVSRQSSGMVSFRNTSTPRYKVTFLQEAGVPYEIRVVHEILTITSYDAATGQVQNSLSL